MKRSTIRALQGIAMAAGAPLGWLLIQRLRGLSSAAEVSADAGLYTYMLVGTMIVFGLFGVVLGNREDHLTAVNRTLKDLSISDALTGLRNARYFHARLAEEHAAWVRTGEPLSLVIVDLDHFKEVNDEHGHVAGDSVLVNVARAMASVVRQGETAARVGGEEFGLLLPGSGAEAAFDAAERVRHAIAGVETMLDSGGVVRITASAGVASTSSIPDATGRQLYEAADGALYRAKADGRNRTDVADGVAERFDARRHAGQY